MKYSKKKAYAKRRSVVPYKRSRRSGLSSVWPFPRRNNVVLPQHIGVGQSVNTDLRTSFFANVTGSGTGVFTGYLKPGSAFDPTGDISTIQPVAYDAWAAVYSRYKVNKAWVTISIIGSIAAGATYYNWVGAAYPGVDPTPLTTYQGAASQSYAKTFSGNFSGGTTLAGTAVPCVRKFVFDNEAVVGSTGDAFDMGALVTSDPTALQFAVLPIFLQSCVSGANPTWVVKVDMFQNVTFSQRKNVIDV